MGENFNMPPVQEVAEMKYLSICSGIEAATVAWHGLGWTPAAFSEIEPFPRAVLAHHYPDVPLHGDFTTIKGNEYGTIDLLCGGTPCQDFSIAGLRKGLAGERGNLTLEFIRLAERSGAKWVVWENVPGVLSQDGGRAFGSFLGGLAECGYGFAYRVIDAQYFGVPQRRRRVFVIGYLGDWRPAAAVLFEQESLRGDITPSRKAGEGATESPISGTVSSKWAKGSGGPAGDECQNLITAKLGHTKSNGVGISDDGQAYTLEATGACNQAVAIGWSEELTAHHDLAGTIQYGGQGGRHDGVMTPSMQVRRLTPRECERLQGFPDDYTLIPMGKKAAADGPRYKALGNSMAVPVMRWLGERIKMVEGLL